MKKQILLLLVTCHLWLFSIAQNNASVTISGKVTNEKNETLADASVRVKGTGSGITTDNSGGFRLTVAALPVTLMITHVSYEDKEVIVADEKELTINLHAEYGTLNPVVVGANLTLTRSINTPVTNVSVGKKELINSPSVGYHNQLIYKTGLDVTKSGFLFNTYSTRGFNLSGSSKVNQLVDGMDNQAPGLNFPVGGFTGPVQTDVGRIEILPGASSALYGPGGVNGTILIFSKSPFDSEGVSIIAQQGVTNIGKKQRDKMGGYYDYTLRWAKRINDRFAFKIGAQYIRAIDWLANDTGNYLRTGTAGKMIPGTRQTDPNYDGVNVYGDETKTNMKRVAEQMVMLGYLPAAVLPLIPEQSVSRTGYAEKDIIDPVTKNIKLSGAVHYKLTDKLEAQLAGYCGTGNTVYTGNNRYAFKDIKIGQYKLELKHKNWFLRGYTTQENAGEAYSATVTSQYFNEAWKKSQIWYPEYVGAFVQAKMAGLPNANAHSMARSYADRNRPVVSSQQFRQLFDSVRKVPIPNGGLFLDKSQLWMTEGQYNFSDEIKFAEIIVGANLKKYILSSQGTIFIDTAGALKINEWGAYAQVSKKLFDDKLTLSASGRLDKNENFNGNFTPRVTALINVAKDHNIRMSYQTAYRFPTTLQQWIMLDVGDAVLLGGLPWILDIIQPSKYLTLVYDPVTGQSTPYLYKTLKPESLRSFEIGYKGLYNKKLLLDAYAYFGCYSDFLGRILLAQPTRQSKLWSVVTNSDAKVKTWGAGVGVDYNVSKKLSLFLNAYTDRLTNVPQGFEAGFNTPLYRVNTGITHTGLGKKEKVGFAVTLRWQDSFYWEGGGFANGDVKAYTTLDAQVNYKLPKIKSIIKLGGTNITNKYYQTSFGNPSIGGMYYASFAYNIL